MLKLQEYQPDFEAQWDAFVDKSCNGTIFHQQRFLGYHGKKFIDRSLVFTNAKNEIVCVFPAAVKNNYLWSHPGASFGGPVIEQIGIEPMLDIVNMIDKYAKDNRFDGVTMVLTPNVFHLSPVEGMEFALFHNGYTTKAVELSICVPLEDVTYATRRKRGIVRAGNCGIEVRESFDLAAYWDILETNLRVRHSTEPTHTVAELEKLKFMYPDQIKLFGAFHKGLMVAGVLAIVNNSTSFETFYIAQDYKYEHMRAMDAAINHVIGWGVGNGYKFMNFGITSEDRGNNINFGLAKFKEEFGGCDIVRRMYSKEIA